MLFSGEERFMESTASCDTSSTYMPQTSYLSSNGGAKMQEPWYQGNPLDRLPTSAPSQQVSPRNNSELDLIKPRQPSFAFSKAPKHPPDPATHQLSTSPIHLPPSPQSQLETRSQSPVKHFGTGPRSQAPKPVSNTPSISIEAADRCFKMLLPTPAAHKFPVTERKQKLAPSSTPGPGQYKPIPQTSRTVTLKSRTKIVGCSMGEDSPGPNSYAVSSTLLKKSHNVRSNGFGSESGGAPNRSKAEGQVSNAELTKNPRPPSKLNIKPSTQSISSRNRNIFHASDLISESSHQTDSSVVLQEHFSKQDVKEARSLFRKMMTRSTKIIENSREAKSNCDTDTLADTSKKETDETDAVVSVSVPESVRTPLYSVGHAVLCNYCDHGQWCPGIISGINSGQDGVPRYDVQYDDGDAEDNRDEEAIMNVPGESSFITNFSYRVGDQVLGNYDEKGIWFEGVLSSFETDDDGNILFDIEYADGDVDYSIPASCIILAPSTKKTTT